MSENPIKIEVFGIGTMEGEIIRHITPLSADAFLEKVPFVMRGRWSFGSKKYWTVPGIGIKQGADYTKARKDVLKGDIIFNPKTDELIILMEDLEMPNKVNKIGEIHTNLEKQCERNGTSYYYRL